MKKNITGVILAGGQGHRMGGVDKGLQLLNGKPLVQWVLERFAPQVDEILVSANQNDHVYQQWGYRILPDIYPNFIGPLAGLHAGLTACPTPFLATCPCDVPFLPKNLVQYLFQALTQNQAQMAIAQTANQLHPVFCVCTKEVLPQLSQFIEQGGRKMSDWHQTLKYVVVPFNEKVRSFRNINTLEELRLADAQGPTL